MEPEYICDQADCTEAASEIIDEATQLRYCGTHIAEYTQGELPGCTRIEGLSSITDGRIFCENHWLECERCNDTVPIDETTAIGRDDRIIVCDNCIGDTFECDGCNYIFECDNEQSYYYDYTSEQFCEVCQRGMEDREEVIYNTTTNQWITAEQATIIQEQDTQRYQLFQHQAREHQETYLIDMQQETTYRNLVTGQSALNEAINGAYQNWRNSNETTGPPTTPPYHCLLSIADECKRPNNDNYKVNPSPQYRQETICSNCIKKSMNLDSCIDPEDKSNWHKIHKHLETILMPYKLMNLGWKQRENRAIKTKPYRMPDENPYLYYGLEIEVEIGESAHTTIAYDIQEIGKGLVCVETDSSVNNGFEIITRPLSYKRWCSDEVKQIIQSIYQYLQDHTHYLKLSQKSCGTHIHISKKFFPDPKSITNLSWLFMYYEDEFIPITQRQSNHYSFGPKQIIQRYRNECVWLQIDNITVSLKKDSKGKSNLSDHHSIVSLSQNNPTIELRAFGPTTDYDMLLTRIEFARNLAHWSRKYSNRRDWEWTIPRIMSINSSPALDHFIKSQKIKWPDKVLKESITIGVPS
jgi:hypothetical protein